MKRDVYTKERIEDEMNIMDECCFGVPCIEFLVEDRDGYQGKFVFNSLSPQCGGLLIEDDKLSFWMKNTRNSKTVAFIVPMSEVTDVFSAEIIFPKMRNFILAGVGQDLLAYSEHPFSAEYYQSRTWCGESAENRRNMDDGK